MISDDVENPDDTFKKCSSKSVQMKVSFTDPRKKINTFTKSITNIIGMCFSY